MGGPRGGGGGSADSEALGGDGHGGSHLFGSDASLPWPWQLPSPLRILCAVAHLYLPSSAATSTAFNATTASATSSPPRAQSTAACTMQLVVDAAEVAWPAAALCSASAFDAVQLLTRHSPAAAVDFTASSFPPERCEHSPAVRAVWVALLANLANLTHLVVPPTSPPSPPAVAVGPASASAGGGAPGRRGGGRGGDLHAEDAHQAAPREGLERRRQEARQEALSLLAEHLPAARLFAMLGDAGVAPTPEETERLRQQSLAGQAARMLRRVAAEICRDGTVERVAERMAVE